MTTNRRVRTGIISPDIITRALNPREPFAPGVRVIRRAGHYRIPLLVPGCPVLYVNPYDAPLLVGKRIDA